MNTERDTLPETLVSLDGKRITTLKQWEQVRRPEILELFRESVYGREPVQRPESLRFETMTEDILPSGRGVRKQVNLTFEGPGGKGVIRVLLFVPHAAPKPVPAFLFIQNGAYPATDLDQLPSGYWPVEQLLARGYAAAAFQGQDLDPDTYDGFHNGVHGIFDPADQPRPSDAWATIAAWAWGASRVMDYFEADPDIDHGRVALVGHSRGGKTSLWAGAADERFAMVVSNNSGCTGAAISRGKVGERVRTINEGFPHWFCDNYKKYNDRETELPVDQHMLLSLIAPRLLYVTSASEDTWADPESEFLSLVLADPAYRLFGIPGLGTSVFPQADTPIWSEKTGYHVRSGQHDLTAYDWQCFLDFADSRL